MVRTMPLGVVTPPAEPPEPGKEPPLTLPVGRRPAIPALSSIPVEWEVTRPDPEGDKGPSDDS
jgi:hypothetical protein